MAYTLTQCGGMKINTTAFKLIDGVVTDANAVSAPNSFNAACGGQYFDTAYFKTVDGVLTTVTPVGVDKSFQANCSLLCDSSQFEFDADGALQYKTAYLTFNVTPADATIVVTDEKSNPIKKNADGTYTVMVTKRYTYTISKTGFTTVTDSVLVSKDATIKVDLKPATV